MLPISKDVQVNLRRTLTVSTGASAPGTGAWLLITAAGRLPGAKITARILPPAGRQAHSGDVLVHLAPGPGTGPLDLPAVRVGAWEVIDGLVIPVAAWDRQDPDGWPERIRATVAFAISVLTELEDHGADLGPAQMIDLDDDAVAATAGIPAGAPSVARWGSGRRRGRRDDGAGQVDQFAVVTPGAGGDHGDAAGPQQDRAAGEDLGDPVEEPVEAVVGEVGGVAAVAVVELDHSAAVGADLAVHAGPVRR